MPPPPNKPNPVNKTRPSNQAPTQQQKTTTKTNPANKVNTSKPAPTAAAKKIPAKPANVTTKNQTTAKSAPSKNNVAKMNTTSSEKKKNNGVLKKTGRSAMSLVKTLIKIAVFLLIIGLGYYGYQYYQTYQQSGDAKGALTTVMNKATGDLDTAKQKSKEYSKVALDKSSEWSATAFEKSEEYAKIVKEFSKETFSELSAKVKKIGEKSPEELLSSADGYLKEFMQGSEMAPSKQAEPTKEPVAPPAAKPTNTPPPANQETASQTPAKPAITETKPVITEKPAEDPTKDGFVTPEKPVDAPVITRAEPKPIESKPEERPQEKPEEPKKKGLTATKVNVGERTNAAVTPQQPQEQPKAEPPAAKVTPENEPPHMKTYKEGRDLFLQGLVHYKKQMPGSPNENAHRRQAYAFFKKASKCFEKVANKMEGNEEFDRISTDNYRYMFGCGKSMLIDQH